MPWRRMGSGCIDPRFIDRRISWWRVVGFTSRLLYPRVNSPGYPLNRRLGGHQRRSGRREENKNALQIISHICLSMNKSINYISCYINKLYSCTIARKLTFSCLYFHLQFFLSISVVQSMKKIMHISFWWANLDLSLLSNKCQFSDATKNQVRKRVITCEEKNDDLSINFQLNSCFSFQFPH
jgi:hypothetical protein